ncbi:MAG: response regulator transcription factor [Peptoniphilaceae bacterium]|nr:response regulator transcription factor [Peptoniphilaceae bacterium]MDD7382885.1 response regulator transcription factor [Peptoniphilaceae bacterium]MDY3738156.1 response regulator transcription factor [Peptoniphilaceae bacterium]
MKKILFLEDEEEIREILSEYMKLADFSITETGNGNEAIEILKKEEFDAVILDIMVNGASGLEVLKFIRENKKISNTNVIMLTALDDLNTQINAFDLYCDDYIVKPVQPILLIKKLEMIMKRRNTNKKVSNKGLYLDEDGFRVLYDGVDLKLTVTEFQIISLLMRNPNKVFSRENIISSLYNIDFYGSSRSIDSHIKNLRKKLPKNFIKTVIGAGYKFNEEI